MTDREKLIELLYSADIPHFVKKRTRKGTTTVEDIADHLLANGVTVLKWHDAAEEKPSDFVPVLGHMTDAGDFPSVLECYYVRLGFYFPALQGIYSVDKWAYMPELLEWPEVTE